jgi:hypothetical protein
MASDPSFPDWILNHIARTAVGPSAARGQGAKNVVATAREYFTKVNLSRDFPYDSKEAIQSLLFKLDSLILIGISHFAVHNNLNP